MSERQDRELSWRERVGLRIHLALCHLCRGFAQEIGRLRRLARIYGDETEKPTDDSSVCLSAESRERLEKLMRDQSS